MDDADRATILRELPHLLQAVQLTPELLSQLLRLRVLTPVDVETLEAEREPRERRRRLLLTVTRRGPHAFEGLVRALLESGQLPAAAELNVLPAERFLGSEGDAYRMVSRPRGRALIISNLHFHNTDLHDHRNGGEVDEALLQALLQQLGLDVHLERNLKRAELRAAVASFAKRDDHGDAAVLAVLTHGGEHVLFGVDSRPLSVEEVIGCFSHEAAPLLAGKPKWLLFQACRGHENNHAVRLRDPARQRTDGRPWQPAPPERALPEFGDLYLTYSTIPGYVSMRDLDRGTWLVQVLCEVIAEHACSHSLGEMHTIIHRRMETIITVDNEKQTIETSQRGWRKKLYFNPGL
ncbi:caspase-2-like [Pollicipes pollicipes]|uniref:caspase-2-like n=1 Tax=Pollicipes pollicipes TaxID=41117 RepID=UPI001885258D|nr:caspase-2-like [Pollicipes pollicipes]